MNNDKYAFKPIKENPIILDLSNCRNLYDLHCILKDKFGFPDYYGKNWSALWDCLDGLFLDEGDIHVKICGYFSLDDETQHYYKPMLEIFDRVHKGTPNVTFEIVS